MLKILDNKFIMVMLLLVLQFMAMLYLMTTHQWCWRRVDSLQWRFGLKLQLIQKEALGLLVIWRYNIKVVALMPNHMNLLDHQDHLENQDHLELETVGAR